MRCIAVCGWLPLVLACSFDATGIGESPGVAMTQTGVATTETGDPPNPTSTGAPLTGTDGSTGITGGGSSSTGAVDPSTGPADPTTGTTTTIDPTTTSDTTTTGSDTTTTGDDTSTGELDQTTGPDPCAMPTKVIVLAVDSSVAAPMGKYVSNQGEGTVVYSIEAEKGTADFAVTLACPGEVAVWARVLDLNPGINDDDPDSLHIRVDGGEEKTWFYGCQTGGMTAGYRWLRIRTGVQGEECDQAVTLAPNLQAGTHNFMLRNREAMNNKQHVAAVARILVTTDLNYVPGGDD